MEQEKLLCVACGTCDYPKAVNSDYGVAGSDFVELVCAECGSDELFSAELCKQCGAPIIKGEDFCENCRRKVREAIREATVKFDIGLVKDVCERIIEE